MYKFCFLIIVFINFDITSMENYLNTCLDFSDQEKIYCLLEHCEKTFHNHNDLIKHFQKDHSLFFFCNCAYLFNSKTALDDHQNNHCKLKKLSPLTLEKKTYAELQQSFCPCNQTNAKTRSGLAAHINHHHYNSANKNFFCCKCFTEFNYSGDVVTHLSEVHHLFIIVKSKLHHY